MNIFEDTNPRGLKELLSLIHVGEMALPDFQRSFVWDPSATQELIISIASNYPAGSILRVRNSDKLFKMREFENAPALNGNTPNYLILDGQQRLTSLYQAFYGKGDHKYFISIKELLDGKDFDECIFHMRSTKADRKYGTIEKQIERLVLPLEVLYGSTNGYSGWTNDVTDFLEDSGGLSREETSTLRRKLQRDIYDNYISCIDHYEFPVVTLTSKTSADAICTIFETLNRTGVKLSVFELLTARFWPDNVNLRSLYDDARRESPLIDDFDIDPYYILQSASLLKTEKAPTCKRKDILKDLTATHISELWRPVIEGLNGILKILSEDCGVLVSKWLPYYTILIPMAAVWASQRDAKGVQIGVNRKKLVQWYWCSIFSQTYENAPNSQAAKDFTELIHWMNGGDEPTTLKEFRFDIDQLRETTPRQRAIYQGVICLILKNRPIDFYEGKIIIADLLKDKKIDDHHIYPKAYLETIGINQSHRRDCVVNRTLIDRTTNQLIGKRPPCDYVSDIEGNLGKETFNDIVRSHLIAKDSESFYKESYDDFIEHRLEILRQAIEQATGKTIDKADGIFEKK